MKHYKYYLMRCNLYVTSVSFEAGKGICPKVSYCTSTIRGKVMIFPTRKMAESVLKAIATPKNQITLHREELV